MEGRETGSKVKNRRKGRENKRGIWKEEEIGRCRSRRGKRCMNSTL